MATLQDVTAALEALKTTALEERTEVLAALSGLTEQIVLLQAQVASGAGVTAADLDALVSQISEVAATVEGIQE